MVITHVSCEYIIELSHVYIQTPANIHKHYNIL